MSEINSHAMAGLSATRRWSGLAALVIALLTVGLDLMVLNVALPTLAGDLGASTTELQWIVNAYTLVVLDRQAVSTLRGMSFTAATLISPTPFGRRDRGRAAHAGWRLDGLMKHPLHQTIEMTAGVTPLLLLGIPVPVAAALSLAVAVQLLLQHSNADYRVGPLKYVLALNEGHRFHHLKWAGIGDVNFGLFTLVWDHLLRTYSYDPARRFSSEDIGMAAKPDYPVGYLAQLAEPFTAHGGCQFTATALQLPTQTADTAPTESRTR
ncbi:MULTISPECIES: sterol desaturase family protein [Nocardia]|uniref:sterol desaturase family protein n=1 Tax=Nocardia TaxID=1817 RepID=UPI000305A12A